MLVHVRGAAHRHDAAPDQHPRRLRRRSPRSTPTRSRCSASSRSTRSSRTARPLGFPERRLPRPRRAATTAASAPTRSSAATIVEAHLEACLEAGLHDLGHQRRGHARPVGVPGRPARPARGRRPALDRPLAALPHRRGLRRRRHPRPQAGQGRLERRRRPHQLLDQGDARELRRRSSPPARRSARTPTSTSRTTAPASRAASPACTRPPRGTSSATACPNRGASVRIPWQVEIDKKGYIEDRRPNANMRPVRRHPADRRDLLRRPGRGRVAAPRTTTIRPRGGAAAGGSPSCVPGPRSAGQRRGSGD